MIGKIVVVKTTYQTCTAISFTAYKTTVFAKNKMCLKNFTLSVKKRWACLAQPKKIVIRKNKEG